MRTRAAFAAASIFAVLVAGVAARACVDVERGLRADYFTSPEPGKRPPAMSLVSAEISTARIAQDWGATLPSSFSARWQGYLNVVRPGAYTFAIASDDGSTLSIDGQLVVDNAGVHGSKTETGRIYLTRGAHPVLLEYQQAGGPHDLQWRWARKQGALVVVPAWVLSPQRVPLWTVVVARALDWAIGVAAALTAIAFLWLGARHRTRLVAALRRHPSAASLLFFVGLAVIQTWPLATGPARLSRNDNGDTILNEWAMAWVAHQAPRDPLRLYDANIFHPERYTLAFSEAMIVQSAFGAPALWLGASPVLAYNLVLLAGLALTGWTTSLVMTRWTGDRAAGLVSGVLAGTNAFTLTRLPHLQVQHGEFLPLALLALDGVLREPRLGHALRLALWFTLQALTSVYLLVFSAFALVAATLARVEDWWGRRFVPAMSHAALAAGVAGLALLPFLLPYWHAYAGLGMTRTLNDAAMYSASIADYLTTPGRLHVALWSHRWTSGTALFPGLTALALASAAVIWGVAFRDPRARMCLAIAVCGGLLSFGVKLPGYATLHDHLPLLHAIRAPVRFGYLVLVAVAFLAGFGLAEVRRRTPTHLRNRAAWVVLLLVVAEPFSAPLRLRPFHGIPAIYAAPRDDAGAVVVELPFPPPHKAFHNAGYLLNSTRHWRPMLNGYSGFVPASYARHFARLDDFPSADAVAALEALDVTHAFVHTDELPAGAEEWLDRSPALQRVSQHGPIVLYRVQKGAQSAP